MRDPPQPRSRAADNPGRCRPPNLSPYRRSPNATIPFVPRVVAIVVAPLLLLAACKFPPPPDVNDDGRGVSSDGGGPDAIPLAPMIAFTSDRTGNLDVFTMRIDGSEVVNLTNDPGLAASPLWSPTGDRLAFSPTALAPASTTSCRPMAPRSSTSPTDQWARSPDGTLVSFSSGGDVLAVPADGGPVVNLTDHAAVDGDASWRPAP
jgi:hypothetical protein